MMKNPTFNDTKVTYTVHLRYLVVTLTKGTHTCYTIARPLGLDASLVSAKSELCFPLLLRSCMQCRLILYRDIPRVDCMVRMINMHSKSPQYYEERDIHMLTHS